MTPEPTIKIAISLPEPLLRAIERAREDTDESRSAFLRRAAESLLRAERHRDRVSEYVQGYLRLAESSREVDEADAAAGEALDDEAWE